MDDSEDDGAINENSECKKKKQAWNIKMDDKHSREIFLRSTGNETGRIKRY